MSWITEKEINEKRAQASQLVKQAGEILETAKSEERDVTAEEEEQFDTLHADAAKIADDVKTLERQARAETLFTHPIKTLDPPCDHKDYRRYSLLKAIRQMANPNEALDGLEKEVSDEIAHRTGKSPQGFYMPMDLPVERFDLTTTTGSGAVGTVTDPANFIELLRNRMLATQLGVRYIGGLVGDLSLPKQTGGATAYWVTECNAPTESNQTVSQVSFAPSTVGAFTDLSRKFIKQSSIDAENFAREDLATVVAIELDRVVFNGSGSGAEPEGILQNSSVSTVALGTNGGAPTWAKMVEMETTVATSNADLGALAYVTTPGGRGKCKTTDRGTDTGKYIWADDSTINGYPAHASNQLPSNLTKAYGTDLHAVIYGNFNDAIVAQWGGLDILVDPYTGSSSGTVRIVVLQDVDFQLRHAESFAKIVDMDVS